MKNTIEMAKRLVGYDTTSRNSNLALIDFVRGYLDDNGVASELVFDDTGGKANLFATIGPPETGGIMLSGHTDVVPADGQDWHSDPFEGEERDDRLIGRGAADMKSFIAAVLVRVPELTRRRLSTPIHLALSYDEEVGCIGVRRLIAALAGRPDRPRLGIIGEPTEMRVVTGHKGKHSLRCHVHGVEAHSSLTHLGVNAIETAAELVLFLKREARHKRDNGPYDPGYAPPYTSIHTGVIRGGTALNIVPGDCEFDFEIRYLPGDDAQPVLDRLRAFAKKDVLPEMRAVGPASDIRLDDLSRSPGLDTPADAEVTRLAAALTGEDQTGRIAFGSEGGLFQEAGIPIVLCGPGSVEQAHKPDEFVALEQIARCERFLDRLIDHVSH